MKMRSFKSFGSGTSLLIGSVVFICALVRGSLQVPLLISVFTLWGLWISICLLLPFMRQAARQKKRRQQFKKFRIQNVANHNEPVEQLLLYHVNHRISAYLQSVYPDVTWEWAEKNPGKIIIQGGVGRIRIYNIADFDHADVTVNKDGNITCNMVKIVPLSKMNPSGSEEKLPPNQQPVDPQIWYEIQGRKILETLIADLNSRGHSSLMFHENGDVCIQQGQDDVPQEHLSNFPQKVYWPRLVQVFERNGLAAEMTAKGIQVSW